MEVTILLWIALLISSLGSINWGLVKFLKFDIVEYVANLVKLDYLKEALYIAISVAGLFALIGLFSCGK